MSISGSPLGSRPLGSRRPRLFAFRHGLPGAGTPSRSGRFKALTILVCACIALASCTNYKAALRLEAGGPSTGAVLPKATQIQKEIVRADEKVTGQVRLRFDVSKTGEVSGVEILEASDERLREKALDLIASWPLEPGTIAGEPADFEDLEYMLVFFTDDSMTTGKAVFVAAGIIVLSALLIALKAMELSNSGSFSSSR